MKSRELDPVYFSTRTWSRRLTERVNHAHASEQGGSFLDGNLTIIRQILSRAEIGLRMAVNIGADALLSFLSTDDYKNIYERPVVGGKRREPTRERIDVDRLLGFENEAAERYFGAVALGGTGVRFYGEWCMVVKPTRVPGDTQLFDRDSYDLLQPPLTGWGETKTKRIVKALRGEWKRDVVDMLIMKILPRLPPSQHLITIGNISGLVMSDQEFVEVHLRDKIRIEHVEEIRQSPDEVAIETTIVNRRRARQSPSLVEIRWVAQRRRVLSRLAQRSVPCRIVTLHGKGYQWT